MSHITSGILGGAAAAVLLGAIQFAFGGDLRVTVPANVTEASQVNSEAVNRSAKSDRAEVVTVQDGSRTLSFSVQGLSGTSLLLRVAPTPVKVEKISVRSEVAVAQRAFKATPQKSAVACEPPVSVLTEVARLLEPGRCVT
ncbi:hypothetical protein [Tardiphaga sp.]|uniref:hypothetical protein n=1 Tax=Tardiphaga sp. TaxID=1926292 RepID=UPI00260B9758|nr:hypothetical protein [Tardiphaga sp.]MDB5619976.1 hypothetical protein [Tardiphaga sp.]